MTEQDRGRRRAVFLDRDGVLNRSDVRNGRPYAPRTLDGFEILPGAAEAVRALKDAGYLTIVVTNQKDLGVGAISLATLDAMHEKLRRAMPLDDIYVCDSIDEGPRYKPNPGMLLEAAADWSIDLSRSFMVGDRWRDVGAGKRAGCVTIFVDAGYDEALRDKPDFRVTDLVEAARLILDEPGDRLEGEE